MASLLEPLGDTAQRTPGFQPPQDLVLTSDLACSKCVVLSHSVAGTCYSSFKPGLPCSGAYLRLLLKQRVTAQGGGGL